MGFQASVGEGHIGHTEGSTKTGQGLSAPVTGKWWVWVLVGTLSIIFISLTTLAVRASHAETSAVEFETNDLVQPKHWKRAGDVPLIGSGTFGIVYLSQNTLNGKQFCTKEVNLDAVLPESADVVDSLAIEQESRMRQEIQLLATYRHPRIVSYLGCEVSASRGRLFIFMEYLAGGTLKDYLKRYGHMEPKLVQAYTRDIMDGLKFLHNCPAPVIHRDIKPANVLLTLDGRCKLADFGCIEVIHNQERDASQFIAGTRLYAPPEMIDGEDPVTSAFDVWSLGVTIYQMLTNEYPWPKHYVSRPKLLIEYHRMVLEHGLPEFDHPVLISAPGNLASEMIYSMLVAAEDRPSIEELEIHPFFKIEYEDSERRTSESEAIKRQAALEKLALIRQGRSTSVTTDLDTSSFTPTGTAKLRVRGRAQYHSNSYESYQESRRATDTLSLRAYSQ